ncbi:bifunctional 3,4-dihydroxy-2-butanone-4-phosphate synthase/GTP cyclohydrolase II [Gracilinema caldarium]|uniref:GTP cyclohydrolase-2 n=1 Tax=Gracilinema caldarium (strain ATCC 51460 / DSM 7334 / H1) TaxID=744872 RepID=F8EWV0_GRAC1|nr:bifunctional 3,4-dihydroxy-2-butanone-4-phosphate synthase/GTP cyclohydrolase II [Gracilinema caldarium]AEJ18336.1 GTP cyclohydrolase-2 [Gracilinema caldarium DSM 7334]
MNRVDEAIKAFRAGKMVIITDHPERENEGDLCIDAQFVTPEIINFMAHFACGLICVPMEQRRLQELELQPMVYTNEDNHRTAFTVSVDHKETTTGISAFERSYTIQKLIDTSCGPFDFRKPGHVFPLAGCTGGVLERQGHTEAVLDLVKLSRSGIPDVTNKAVAGVICEILNSDGSMARQKSLENFAKTHNLCMISVDDLIRYRKEQECGVTRETETILPTKYGNFKLIGYTENITKKEHVVLTMGDVSGARPVLCRIHSECLTGDAFGSLRCDCGEQFKEALRLISTEGRGVLVYLRQEGRGIGLINKLKAYALQDTGVDTVDANLQIGFPADMRDYRVGALILKDLGVQKVRLITNNPQKIKSIEQNGIQVSQRIPICVQANEYNTFYLQTKQKRMCHQLELIDR